ncbi:CsbD family protein [Sessilibacter sp. MAH2]
MNKDMAEGKWKEVKGEIRKTWAKISDDEVEQMAGSQEKFEGSMQKHYGKSKEEAREAWEKLTKH